MFPWWHDGGCTDVLSSSLTLRHSWIATLNQIYTVRSESTKPKEDLMETHVRKQQWSEAAPGYKSNISFHTNSMVSASNLNVWWFFLSYFISNRIFCTVIIGYLSPDMLKHCPDSLCVFAPAGLVCLSSVRVCTEDVWAWSSFTAADTATTEGPAGAGLHQNAQRRSNLTSPGGFGPFWRCFMSQKRLSLVLTVCFCSWCKMCPS